MRLLSQFVEAALNKWKVYKLPDDLYRFMDCDDPDLKLILDAFQIKLPTKLYRKSEPLMAPFCIESGKLVS